MKFQVGQRVTGRINSVTDLGIFVTLPKHASGLIHHNDFGSNWVREQRKYQIGDSIRVVIINNKGKIDLSKMRLNDATLIDPTNEFSNTKKEDFLPVLTKTMNDAQTEIKKLQQEMTNYAS